MKNTQLKMILISTALMTIMNVSAQEFIFPKNGQSKEQQQQDEYACHTWAVGETGFDPTKAAAPTAIAQAAPVPQGAAPGSGTRGALRGAAAGAIIAEIGDNDVSNGAAKGAAIGAISSRRRSKKANAKAAEQQAAADQQAQQAQQMTNEQISSYNKARHVCLDAKGYSISN